MSSSKIAVRPRNKRMQYSSSDIKNDFAGNVFLQCEAARQTEQDALSSLVSIPELTALHRRIAELERMTRDTKYLPDYDGVIDRPARAIYGCAALAWIGKQPGVKMRAKEVKEWIKDIERIYKIRADHGMMG